MRYLLRLSALAGFACLFPAGGSQVADKPHQLSDRQVRARFARNVLTDGTHWRETYVVGGRLLVEEMGTGGASAGSWRIEGERLCKTRPGILSECYAVWVEKDRVELRHPSYPPLVGFLVARSLVSATSPRPRPN